MVDQRSSVLRAVVGMDGQAWPFVHQQDLFILIDDIQFRHRHRQVGIVLPGLVEKLIVDIKLEHISRLQAGVPFRTGSVALDALNADIFLGQRRRQQRHRFCQEAIQALPRVIGADLKFFHIGFLRGMGSYSARNDGLPAP